MLATVRRELHDRGALRGPMLSGPMLSGPMLSGPMLKRPHDDEISYAVVLAAAMTVLGGATNGSAATPANRDAT